jgi:hypothetical protein
MLKFATDSIDTNRLHKILFQMKLSVWMNMILLNIAVDVPRNRDIDSKCLDPSSVGRYRRESKTLEHSLRTRTAKRHPLQIHPSRTTSQHNKKLER